MPETVLRTKLFIPPLRPNLVPRSHLIRRLNQGLFLGHKLSLISAPAGFGKTTLASEWLASCGRPASWLSLDEGDNEVTRFLTYFVTALQTSALPAGAAQSEVDEIAANIGEGALAALQSPQAVPAESILTVLLNEISAVPYNFILVLDDYHVIEARSVDNALAFLIEHLPPQMHLVIATREDPNLPLARLRGRGQLSELRIADLRFTNSEAARFLDQVMGLNLSADEIGSLERRTEGWIAGLQMAALSMQGRADAVAFIHAFTGSHHFVLDYLVEEVLQGQPEYVRSFLLQTSILDRLSGPLCDVVTRQENSQELLETLNRGNLFVTPLDDQRHWYRYHQLFADVLQARLTEEQPALVPSLHLLASEWYELNGSPADSIRYALAAEDFERAAGLVELAWPAMDGSFQSATWLGWVKALPDELVRARPVLSVDYGWALINDGDLEAGEVRLQDAERWLESTAVEGKRPQELPAGMVVVDEKQFRSLPVTIASARSYHAQALGDIAGSVKYARQALDLLPASDYFGRGRAAVLLGIAHWSSGDLEVAHHCFEDAMASFQKAGNAQFAISFTFILADIRMAQGRLHDSFNTYQYALRFVTGQGEPMTSGTEDLYRGLSELYRERGDLEAAGQYLIKSEELSHQSEVYQYRLCIAKARIKVDQGDLDGALDLLDEADRWQLYRNPLPNLHPVAALKTRVWIAQGRLVEALGWVRERGLSVDDNLSYLREFEHLTMVRVLIARYRSDRVERSIHDAVRLIVRLLKAAEAGGRMGSVIEILLLQALAHEAQDDIPPALMSLERALALAEPEGYVRIFVDEGAPMVKLLREAAKQGAAPNYVNKLLAAFGKNEDSGPITQLLIEPLSERELDVLRLLGTELSGPEIARELMVSPNTMRTHTKNIYSKLGVHNRRTAVRRAEELDLL